MRHKHDYKGIGVQQISKSEEESQTGKWLIKLREIEESMMEANLSLRELLKEIRNYGDHQ